MVINRILAHEIPELFQSPVAMAGGVEAEKCLGMTLHGPGWN